MSGVFSSDHGMPRTLARWGLAGVMGVTLPWVADIGTAFGDTRSSAAAGGAGSLVGALGSLGGMIDDRTGQVRFGVALGEVSGPAGSGLGLEARFSQGLAWEGVDRFGLGAGWSWGLPFVDVERGKLVLPSGEFGLDDKAASGLRDYKLKDVRFSASGGSSPVQHAYVLESVKDGSKHYFDAAGDPVAVADRFGHTSVLSWQVVNGEHRLTGVTGAWGAKLSVVYAGSKVTVTKPQRSGQQAAPSSVITLAQGRVTSVTDAAGQKTAVEWTSPQGARGLVVPSVVISPTGARTEFEYRTYEERSGGVVAVSRMQVLDAQGRTLVGPVSVSLDPDGANGGRNWTGCPTYCADGTDRLAQSGDGSFTYRVMFSQADGQQVERTYNALHLQKSEVSRVKAGAQAKDVSRVELEYPGQKADGAPPKVMDAPANYQTPSSSTVVTIDPADPSRTRSSSARAQFDEMGRQVTQEQAGLVTSTQYGANSIPVRTETRDTGSGARQIVENTLTGDGKAVASTTVKASDGKGEPRTTSTTSFEYHTGELAGEVSKTVSTGDASAPGGDPGPATTTTRTAIAKDAKGVGQRTDTVTGPDGVTSSTVSDLASGAPLSTKTEGRGEESTQYDIADRPVRSTGADGTVTRTDYQVTDTGASTTVTRETDGFAIRSSTDQLGREVSTESNYEPSGDRVGAWRQIAAATYDTSGRQNSSTDAAGRETRTEFDAWGRPAVTTEPDGTRTLASYDDAAGTSTSALVPPGQDTPAASSTQTVDEQGNPVKTETAYGDGTPGSRTETQFDAFGKPLKSQGHDGFDVVHAYTPAGVPTTDTLVPQGPGGAQTTAEYSADAFGNKTRKDLNQGGATTSGWTSVFDAAGRSKTLTAPGGGTSAFGYNAATGLVESVTRPDGSTVHQRHDGLGRGIEAWTSPAGAPQTRQEHTRTSYDPLTGKVSAVWFAGDEQGSKTSFVYLPDGSVKERVDPGGKKTVFTYTDLGLLASVTDHTGAKTAYTYDRKTDRMTGAVQTRDGKELARVSYAHDALGRLTSIDRGNGARTEYTYNDAGRVTGEKHTAPGGAVIAQHAYTHTNDGKLATDVADTDGVRTATAYTYNAHGRLASSHVTEGSTPGQGTLVSKADHTNDLASNVTETRTTTRGADGKETTKVVSYKHAPASRTTTVTTDGVEAAQTYDQAGRLTKAADGTTHTYNTTGQLTRTTGPDGTTVTTAYNPLGERATQTTATKDGDSNTLTYHPGTETDQTGTTTNHLTGQTLESRTLTGPDAQPHTAYYLTNRHGDKTHTLDQKGATTSRTTYTDYGTPTTTPGTGSSLPRTGAIGENPYGYAGQYTTPTGHQPLGNRWYNPKAAAFTTPDTPAAGMLNPYTYTTGDPVNQVDPTGTSPMGDWLSKALEWEGLPYLDLALAAAAVGITLYTGGAGAPFALAMLGMMATLPAAADQIAIDSTGAGFLPGDVRTAFTIASIAGAGADIAIGATTAAHKVFKSYKLPDAVMEGPAPAARAALGGAAPATGTLNTLAKSVLEGAAPAATGTLNTLARSVPNLPQPPSANQLLKMYHSLIKDKIPAEMAAKIDTTAFRNAYRDGYTPAKYVDPYLLTAESAGGGTAAGRAGMGKTELIIEASLFMGSKKAFVLIELGNDVDAQAIGHMKDAFDYRALRKLSKSNNAVDPSIGAKYAQPSGSSADITNSGFFKPPTILNQS